jgi:hypothetical protein
VRREETVRGERERGAHAHGLEPAEECALATGVVVGCSTPVFASCPSTCTLIMDPVEGVEVGEEECRDDGGGGRGGASGAPRVVHMVILDSVVANLNLMVVRSI